MKINLYELKRPPANALTDYVKPPASVCMEAELADWLSLSLRPNNPINIHVPECFFDTIAKVEKALVDNRYKVQFIALPGKTASAEFFLERQPAQ